MKQVDLLGLHVEAVTGTPLVLLREHDEPHRIVPIFVGGPEAESIAAVLRGEIPERPQTHDLLANMMEQLDAHVRAVEVTEMRGGTFLAELVVQGPLGDTRVDSRPSDALALALRVGAPLFMSEAVLDEAGATLTEVDDLDDGPIDDGPIDDGPYEPDEIDAAVAEFADFLDELEPSDFGDPD